MHGLNKYLAQPNQREVSDIKCEAFLSLAKAIRIRRMKIAKARADAWLNILAQPNQREVSDIKCEAFLSLAKAIRIRRMKIAKARADAWLK
ncbi:MAG: hypothetical protein E7254_03970 [Lachnospiraceae bacterium]|nr:hypothetical protein [Lachnospiraceae bacterium]